MRIKTVFLSSVVCICLILTSCGLLPRDGFGLFGDAKSDTPASSKADNELAKYNAYMEFLNFTNEWYEAMCYIYFDEFGMEYDLMISNDFDGFTLDGDDASSSIYEMYADQTYAPRKYLSAAPDYGETDARNMIEAGSEDIENEMTGMVGTGGRNYPIDRFRQRMGMLISEYNNSVS